MKKLITTIICLVAVTLLSFTVVVPGYIYATEIEIIENDIDVSSHNEQELLPEEKTQENEQELFLNEVYEYSDDTSLSDEKMIEDGSDNDVDVTTEENVEDEIFEDDIVVPYEDAEESLPVVDSVIQETETDAEEYTVDVEVTERSDNDNENDDIKEDDETESSENNETESADVKKDDDPKNSLSKKKVYTQSSSSTTINVTKKSIDKNYSGNVATAINEALRKAGKEATDSKQYTVKVEAGSYTLNATLKIGSNTTLELSGVNFKRGSASNMLLIENYIGIEQAGYCYKNITIKGGVFDHNGGSNVAVKLAHVKNIKLENVTIKNAFNAHLLETAGVSGMTLSGCTFTDQKIDKDKLYYEAVQLDIPVPEHFNTYRYEALTSKDVLIENCTFRNVPRGVGSHTAVFNSPFSGLVIKGCTFEKCDSAAIQCINWNNINITGNTIKNCTRGIALYSILDQGNGTFLPSYIYNVSGAVTSSASRGLSDKYNRNTSTNSNINIKNNSISLSGSDPYVSYKKTAIFVGGCILTNSRKYSDKSGNLPAGDYYLNNINIINNNIVSNGDGIRFENAKNVIVSDNTIKYNIQKGDNETYYGIQLRTNSKGVEINNNTVDNSPSNAIFINVDSSADNIKSNKIKNPGKYGIVIEGGTAGKISGNSITTPESTGIFIFKQSKANEISSNTVIAKKAYYGHSISISDRSNAGTITKNLVSAPNGYYGINVSYASSVNSIKENAAATDRTKAVSVSSDSKVSTQSGNYKVKSLFKDVMNAGNYYCMPVYWAFSKGITNGYKDGTFGPAKNCTRAHVVTFLWRMAGKPQPKGYLNPFKDVRSDQYYYKAVLWAAEKGIVKGYKDGTFKPNATCLREHVVTFLWRYAGKPKVNIKTNPFNDVKKSDYYYMAAIWSNSKGIAKGYTSGRYKGGFGPKLDCLREHVVTFLYRYKH